MAEAFWFVYIVSAVILGIVVGFIGREKGRSGWGWFWAGLFLSLLGLIAVCAVPRLEKQVSERQLADEPSDASLGPWLRGGKLLRDSTGPESNGKPTKEWGWTWAWIICVIVAAGMFIIAALVSNRGERPNTYSGSSLPNRVEGANTYSGSSPSNSGSSLSASQKRAIFYNIVKTQDMNPDSNEWNQGAKEAAAKYHNIPMSEVNDIILEGVKSNWPTPDL